MASTDLVPASEYQSLAPQTLDLVREAIGTGQLREFDLKRVRMATGGGLFWNVPALDGEEAVKELQGVVLHHKSSRTYWAKDYDGSNDPPDCSSRNAIVATPRQQDNDDPDAPVEFFQPPAQQVGEQGMTPLYQCDTCQFAQWGTKIRAGKQTRGQACKLSRQLFLLAPVTRLPLVVNLPPTSLRGVTDYLLNLLDYGVDHRSIITRITLEKMSGKGVPDYAVAKFSTGERLDQEQFDLAVAYSDMLAPAFEQVTPDRADVDDVAAA